MAQYLRPKNDTIINNWYDENGGTTNIYTSIDESSPPSDSDYIECPAQDTLVYCTELTSANDPSTNINHTIRVRWTRDKTNKTMDLVVKLYDLTDFTTVKEWTITNNPSSFTTYEYTLTEAEASNINSYSTLRFYINGDNYGGSISPQVSWIELEVPDVPIIDYSKFKTPIGTETSLAWNSGQFNVATGMRSDSATPTSWMWAPISSSSNYYYPSGSPTKWSWTAGNTGV
jgi:hypothetical protein